MCKYFILMFLPFSFTWQIDKAANNKSQSVQHDQQIDESEDEEVEEFLYGEDDDEPPSNDNDD